MAHSRAALAAIMLTHFHSDHIGDLGEINLETWANGRDHPLRVYGPPGVDQVVNGFAQAYSLDEGYRIAHHGAALMPPANWQMQPLTVKIDTPPGASPCAGGSATVLEENGLKVTAFTVDHAPVAPAYGYRFDYKGRSVVVSGDTIKCANLVAVAKGADVLIHEAQAAHLVKLIQQAAEQIGNARVAKIMSDIRRYHTTPLEAASEANEAGVQLLVLSHIGPPTLQPARAHRFHARRCRHPAARRSTRLRRLAPDIARRLERHRDLDRLTEISKAKTRMTLEYDLFWSFRSPYSYLVTPRLIEFEREYDVKANVRPVYPIAVRIPGFFKQVNPMWPPYLFRDCTRIAEMLGMPFALAQPRSDCDEHGHRRGRRRINRTSID